MERADSRSRFPALSMVMGAIAISWAASARGQSQACVPIKIWTDAVEFSYLEVVNGSTSVQPGFGFSVAFEVYDAAGKLLNSGYHPWTQCGLAAGQHVLVTTPALGPIQSAMPDDTTLVVLPASGQSCLNDAGGAGRWYCVHWGNVTNIIQTDRNSAWGQFSERITVGVDSCQSVARTNAQIMAGGGGSWQADPAPVTLIDSAGLSGTFLNPAWRDGGMPDAGVADGAATEDGGAADAARVDGGRTDAGLEADGGGTSPAGGCSCGSGTSTSWLAGIFFLAGIVVRGRSGRRGRRRQP
jgi:hypothetical protein